MAIWESRRANGWLVGPKVRAVGSENPRGVCCVQRVHNDRGNVKLPRVARSLSLKVKVWN